MCADYFVDSREKYFLRRKYFIFGCLPHIEAEERRNLVDSLWRLRRSSSLASESLSGLGATSEGNDNRMAEGYQGIPDSGLANEYMRLQDDFVKWQQQLLQNQQLLHNRVAPIAANPPVLNSTGIIMPIENAY
ncbi:hypothetical protein Anas_07084 [Armadillidium nasatum]|uniref:Uncharacterized protein n=1 Tax=Armadillidium nasatum TaxID=96803 RepID=A0A5N5TJH8_9CRUS|nr:hypothetical protein Anas_07084 [Armadillidium nasatum]